MRGHGDHIHSKLVKGYILTSMRLILEMSLGEISICFLLTTNT